MCRARVAVRREVRAVAGKRGMPRGRATGFMCFGLRTFCVDQTELVRNVRWREAQDAGLEVRSRIGTLLIDRAHALLLYLDLLRSRQRPRASPDETKMDGRSSDMDG